MGFLDGLKAKTPAEIIRENKRMLDRSIRELDRERMGVENNIKKTSAEIKKMAKAGQTDLVRIMAKDVVRMKGQVSNLLTVKYQMNSASSQMANMKSQQALAKGMANLTRSMKVMNKQCNLQSVQKMMMEYERQSELLGSKQEIMDDVMDDVLATEDEELKTEEMIDQVLDKIGVSIISEAGSVSLNAKTKMQEGEREESIEDDSDLLNRLNTLRSSK